MFVLKSSILLPYKLTAKPNLSNIVFNNFSKDTIKPTK